VNIKKMKYLIHLVQSKTTGTPKELAEKIAVSERMAYHYLKQLKEKSKAPIKYNSHIQSYFFSEEGNLKWEWEPDDSDN
jgi:transcriptional antiterminator